MREWLGVALLQGVVGSLWLVIREVVLTWLGLEGEEKERTGMAATKPRVERRARMAKAFIFSVVEGLTVVFVGLSADDGGGGLD